VLRVLRKGNDTTGSLKEGNFLSRQVSGFEVLTAVSTKIAVFWVVAPYSLVEVYQHFRGPCCLSHHHPDDGGSKDL
jgi:hypothetical protein